MENISFKRHIVVFSFILTTFLVVCVLLSSCATPQEMGYSWSDPIKGDAYTMGEESFGDYYKVEALDNEEAVILTRRDDPSFPQRKFTPSSPDEDGLLGSSGSFPVWYNVALKVETNGDMSLTCNSVDGERKTILYFKRVIK